MDIALFYWNHLVSFLGLDDPLRGGIDHWSSWQVTRGLKQIFAPQSPTEPGVCPGERHQIIGQCLDPEGAGPVGRIKMTLPSHQTLWDCNIGDERYSSVDILAQTNELSSLVRRRKRESCKNEFRIASDCICQRLLQCCIINANYLQTKYGMGMSKASFGSI